MNIFHEFRQITDLLAGAKKKKRDIPPRKKARSSPQKKSVPPQKITPRVDDPTLWAQYQNAITVIGQNFSEQEARKMITAIKETVEYERLAILYG